MLIISFSFRDSENIRWKNSKTKTKQTEKKNKGGGWGGGGRSYSERVRAKWFF